MMSNNDPIIGQKWKRPNGNIVEVTDSRIEQGLTVFEITPVPPSKGRKSWKWGKAIAFEFTLVEEML